MIRHLALNTFAGWLAGTLCSLGGAVKDSPLEGFKRSTFPRSMIVATFWGIASTALTSDFFLAFAFAGYFERLTVEGWKIIRAKRPSKFVSDSWASEWGHRTPLASAIPQRDASSRGVDSIRSRSRHSDPWR